MTGMETEMVTATEGCIRALILCRWIATRQGKLKLHFLALQILYCGFIALTCLLPSVARAADLPAVPVEGQPLAANVQRLVQALELWRVRGKRIAAAERDEAEQTFQKMIQRYRQIMAECPEGS